MKKYYLALLLILLFDHPSYCQQKGIIDTSNAKEGDVDIALNYLTIINKPIIGFNFNIVGFPKRFWGTGINVNFTTRNLDTSFDRNIKKPFINYIGIGWLNVFRPLNTQRLTLSVSLLNGLSFAALEDRSKRVGKGYKDVVDNYYYLLEPGIDFALKINKNAAIIIKDCYRIIPGYSHFGRNSDFSGNVFAAGVRLYGDTNP